MEGDKIYHQCHKFIVSWKVKKKVIWKNEKEKGRPRESRKPEDVGTGCDINKVVREDAEEVASEL